MNMYSTKRMSSLSTKNAFSTPTLQMAGESLPNVPVYQT